MVEGAFRLCHPLKIIGSPPLTLEEQRLSLLGLIIPHCSLVSEVGRESGVHMPATHLVGLSHPRKKSGEFRPDIEYYLKQTILLFNSIYL